MREKILGQRNSHLRLLSRGKWWTSFGKTFMFQGTGGETVQAGSDAHPRGLKTAFRRGAEKEYAGGRILPTWVRRFLGDVYGTRILRGSHRRAPVVG